MKGAPGEGSQPQAQSKIWKVHDDGRDRGKAAAQIRIREVNDDGRNRGKAVAQREIEELHDEGRDRGKAAVQVEIEELYDEMRRRKAVARREMETVPFEMKFKSYPSIIPSSINETWAWAEEMEQLQLEEEAAEASRKNENSLFHGNDRGKLKKAFDRVKGTAAVARWGDGSSRGLSIAEIRQKFGKILKKQTWKREEEGRKLCWRATSNDDLTHGVFEEGKGRAEDAPHQTG